MPISDSQYQDWLQQDAANRCVLVDLTARVSGVETPMYLSNKNYQDGSLLYLPIVAGGLQFTEDMGITGQASMSYGDIEFDNTNGDYDTAFGWVWRNRAITVRLGDVSWPKADFRVILDGLIDDIGASSQKTITIKVRDKLQRLNTPLSETKLGGSTDNKEELIPLTFGEVCNVTPLLTNPATLEYQVHNSAIEDIIEVRDNGIPVSISKNLANGKFTLTNRKPIGAVTCSVQGDKPSAYSDNIATLIQRIVKSYGKTTTQFTDSDIDLTNFSTFAAANTQAVGVYVNARDNVIDVIQGLANSIDARLVMSRLGKLRLYQVGIPSGSSTKTITAADMEAKSLTMIERIPVQSGFVIGYCKNWTVQRELKTAIPAEHKAYFAEDYRLVRATDSGVAAIQKDHTTPETIQTYLLKESEAQAEAARRLAVFSPQRTLYQFNGFASCLDLELGQLITVQHPRFGMSSGTLVMVVKLVIDWFKGRVQVTVAA